MLLVKQILMNTKKRNYSLDFASGILIIHMILGHIFQWTSLTNNFLYKDLTILFFFFMPWFFFKSGMFHPPQRSLKETIKNGLQKLISPSIPAVIVGLIVYYIDLISQKDFDLIHYFITPIKAFILSSEIIGNSPLWFIIALFCIKLLFSIYLNIKSQYKIIVVIFILLYFNLIKVTTFPLFINNILLGFIFYVSGFYLSKKIKPYIVYLSGIIYICCLFRHQIVDFHTNNIIEGYFIGWIIASIFSIILFNYTCNAVAKQKINFITKVGECSMTIYIYHWPILYLSSIITKYIFIPQNEQFLFYFFTSTILLFLLCYITKR